MKSNRREGRSIRSRWNLGVEGWGRREGCALLRGPREHSGSPIPELTSKGSVCAGSHSEPSRHTARNSRAQNPPWLLFTPVDSDSLPCKVFHTSPKLACMCRLVDFGACKSRPGSARLFQASLVHERRQQVLSLASWNWSDYFKSILLVLVLNSFDVGKERNLVNGSGCHLSALPVPGRLLSK